MVSFLFSVFNMSWTVHAQEKLDSPHDEGPRLSQTTCSEFSLLSFDQTFHLDFCIQCLSLKVSVKIMFYFLVSRVSQNLLNSDRAACARSSQTSRRKAVCVRGVRPSSLQSKRPADAHQSHSQVVEHVYICQWFPTSRTRTPGYLLRLPGGTWKDCRLITIRSAWKLVSKRAEEMKYTKVMDNLLKCSFCHSVCFVVRMQARRVYLHENIVTSTIIWLKVKSHPLWNISGVDEGVRLTKKLLYWFDQTRGTWQL